MKKGKKLGTIVNCKRKNCIHNLDEFCRKKEIYVLKSGRCRNFSRDPELKKLLYS